MAEFMEAIGALLLVSSIGFLIMLCACGAYWWMRYFWLVFKSRNDRLEIIFKVIELPAKFKEITTEEYYGLRVSINDLKFYPEQKGELKRLKKHLERTHLKEKDKK